MYSRIKSAVLNGLNAQVIEVESQINFGMPHYVVVGLPSVVVREAKDRVRSAIKSSQLSFPSQRLTQNLIPVHLKKEGAHLDLPLALGILFAQIKPKIALSTYAFLGELSLNGDILPVKGILGLIEGLKMSGVTHIVLPTDNIKDIYFCEGVTLYPYKSLQSLYSDLEKKSLKPLGKIAKRSQASVSFDVDYNEVIGQGFAIRAVEIAVAGWHHILLAGPPGCGKSMIANRIHTILPEMTMSEHVAVDHIKQLFGSHEGYYPRPVMMPHHSITKTALIGGVQSSLPGLISKAHLGALILDELTQFKPDVLEGLREPLTEKQVALVKKQQILMYPCDFIAVATTNLCSCGYFMSKENLCRCNDFEIKRYLKRISGPIWNRFSLVVLLDQVKDLQSKQRYHSKDMRDNINRVRQVKKDLCKNLPMDNKVSAMLHKYIENGKMSMRNHMQLIDVSETIALLDGKESIGMSHLLEAYSYQTGRDMLLMQLKV